MQRAAVDSEIQEMNNSSSQVSQDQRELGHPMSVFTVRRARVAP